MSEPRAYMSASELAEHIPFSEQAIRMLVHKREFLEDVHFFRRGRKVVFKWAAICEWIEGRKPDEPAQVAERSPAADIVPLRKHG